MSFDSFKNCYQQAIRLPIIFVYKQDLALNNQSEHPLILLIP